MGQPIKYKKRYELVGLLLKDMKKQQISIARFLINQSVVDWSVSSVEIVGSTHFTCIGVGTLAYLVVDVHNSYLHTIESIKCLMLSHR